MFLSENNIRFESQKTFNSCRNKKPLPFDFYLHDYHSLIEYDGEQHFYPVKFGGMNQDEAKERLLVQQRRDKLKNELIAENQQDVNIFIRFSYKETITKTSVEDKITRAVFLSQ